MNGLLKYLKQSNTNLQNAISKTKDKKLKVELEKRLEDNKTLMGKHSDYL